MGLKSRQVKDELAKHSNVEDALFLQRFFKTGEGQYGAGDVFIGVRMGPVRAIAKQFNDLPLTEVHKLLDSKVHEHRMTGLIILTLQYKRASDEQKQKIYDLYINNVYKGRINNWDLIDVTAKDVIGEHLVDRSREILFDLARSDDLWQRRVSILSSFAFIRKGDPSTTLELAQILLHDNHDLIHKAVGWSLREVGKSCDTKLLTEFLDLHAHEMPRTMLRYSLEHLPQDQKQHYMSMKTCR